MAATIPRVALTAFVACAAIGTGTAAWASHRAPAPKEGSLVGDAWVSFPGDSQYPLRRFVVNVHGNPWKIVNGKMIMGAARGTIRYDHYAPQGSGRPVHTWNTIKVDFLETSGPIALVSGIQQDPTRPANQKRANLTFYQSPRGHRDDRVGFTWGLANAECQIMGTGPAPVSTATRGPDGHRLKGYTIKDAPLPLSGLAQGPDDPPNCTYGTS